MSEHISGNVDSFNINSSFNKVWNNYTVADEDSGILAWLSPGEPHIRHHDIRARRVDKVGDWFLETEEFQNWLGGIGQDGSDGKALFCYGDPGVGKSYISSLVIDMLSKQAMEENASVACFYFDFAIQEGQSPDAILSSVLKQVVSGLDEVPERIFEDFRCRGRVASSQKLVRSEVMEYLQDILSSRPTFICFDALDEYPDRHRVELLNLLKQIPAKAPSTRLFPTGRPQIRCEAEKHLAGRAATRQTTATKNDIITFLRAKLKEDTMPEAMSKSLEEEIIQKIPETVLEIFLLAFLTIDTILQETTISRRREKLGEMKSNLGFGGAYGATLERIKAQGEGKARLGMAVLMWITYSKRALQVDELCHALAVRIGSNELDSDNIPGISTVLACCQGLTTIEKGTSTVRLIHFTLKEFLGTNPDLFDRAHLTIAETCLTYLNFQHIKGISPGPSPDPRDLLIEDISPGPPFLEYSSLYWGIHMRAELSDRAETFALQLLDRFDSHIAAELLWKSIRKEFAGLVFVSWKLPYNNYKGFSALHCISYFGIAKFVNTLIDMGKWDVNKKDGEGITPLIWAAICGHEEVVRLLLCETYIQLDERDSNFGRTALSWAAGCGHEGVVRLFLGPQFVNTRSISRLLGAPLVKGKLFRRRYVNPNTTDRQYGQTPLLWATSNGHDGIVKLLLERKDVKPDAIQKEFCRIRPNEGIVNPFLERNDLNSDTPDKWYGQTPLSRAVERGHLGIVKLLLERKDVNPDTPDTVYGLTPLSLAAQNGHEGIVKLFLERNDVNPNTPDTEYGRTPLLWAAQNGHEGVVQLLLERKDVNPDTPDMEDGQRPLSRAAMSGHEGIVKLFLERNDVNPDLPDTKYGQTPLSQATTHGHMGTVELLLRRKDVNTRGDGQTLFLLAAQKGHEGVMKLLLERNVNPDTPDKTYGQTPLLLAAENGHEGVVKLLLDRKDVNPDTPDGVNGRTPLSWAAGNGHEEIVKLLLDRKDFNPCTQATMHEETPIWWAAHNGHAGIVKLLLERKDVTPVPWAVQDSKIRRQARSKL